MNIWTPTTDPDAGLPVLVWFYGGSFLYGSASDPATDGERLAALGAVVVAANYRVGLLGYLAHPALTAESPEGSSGNYGLLDNLAALRWVRENVRRYGGDSQKVCALGVSAGSASLALLQTSPLSKEERPFDRLILHSPGSFRPLASLTDAEAGAVEAYGDDLERMRAWSAAEVLEKASALVPRVRGLTTPRLMRPIRDGWVIPRDDRVSFTSGDLLPVPTIVGSAADEGGALTAGWPIDTSAALDDLMARDFPSATAEARRHYRPAGSSEADVRVAVARLFGDTQFSFGARGIARSLAAAGVPAYRFRHDGVTGQAGHGDEIPDLFALDEPVGSAMADAWIRFAGGQAPHPDWPPYGPDEPLWVFGASPALGGSEGDARLDFLDDYYAVQEQGRQ